MQKSACLAFGGIDKVRAKIFATLVDLQKEGVLEAEYSLNKVDDVASFGCSRFKQLMFMAGRSIDSALPTLDVSKVTLKTASCSVGSNGEMAPVTLDLIVSVQDAAITEVCGDTDLPNIVDTAEIRQIFQEI